MTCAECGSEAVKLSRGKCRNCYVRWWKAQKRAGVSVQRPTLVERFSGRISEQESGCVHWMGQRDKQGYGRISVGGSLKLTHRVAYELFVGPIPKGAHLDHVCHNVDLNCSGGPSCLHRRCVNPAHLDPVSILENLRRSPIAPYGKPPREKCSRGHELTEENVYTRPNGQRRCRVCMRDQNRAWYAEAHPRSERRFCGKGHELTEDNTYRYGNRRVCRQCRRDADRQRYWRRRKP